MNLAHSQPVCEDLAVHDDLRARELAEKAEEEQERKRQRKALHGRRGREVFKKESR